MNIEVWISGGSKSNKTDLMVEEYLKRTGKFTNVRLELVSSARKTVSMNPSEVKK